LLQAVEAEAEAAEVTPEAEEEATPVGAVLAEWAVEAEVATLAAAGIAVQAIRPWLSAPKVRSGLSG